MLEFIKKMIGDKKEYREQMARVEALPEDYRFVFEKIQGYMWNFAGGDGSDMLKTQYELIELFEASAADGKKRSRRDGRRCCRVLPTSLCAAQKCGPITTAIN